MIFNTSVQITNYKKEIIMIEKYINIYFNSKNNGALMLIWNEKVPKCQALGPVLVLGQVNLNICINNIDTLYTIPYIN